MIDRFKEFRKSFFKTQKELANVLHISNYMISEYEHGKTPLSIDKLYILADKYNLNINWLLTGKGLMILDDTQNKKISEELDRLKIENNLLKELLKDK